MRLVGGVPWHRPLDRQPSRAGKGKTITKRLVEGKVIRLEYDRRRQDTFGRPLAYVYLEDGTFVNAEIIRQGYGFVYTRFPFTYLEEFQHLESEARQAMRGVWAER